MKLVIGNMDKQTVKFIKNSTFTDKMILINKMCNVKNIKEEVDIIIPYNIILNSGLISNTMVHLEELIITLNVRKIYYSNSYNLIKMNYFKNTYNVEVIRFDITKCDEKFIF